MLLGEKKRPETGAMEFADDWKGIFIRGDDAFGYGLLLERLLRKVSDTEDLVIEKAQLHGLINLLSSSHQHIETNTQKMKVFDACRRDS